MVEKTKHNKVIAYNLKELRCNKGWTQKELANELQRNGYDISRDTIGKLETATQNFTIPLLVKLRQIFELDSYDVFFRDIYNELI